MRLVATPALLGALLALLPACAERQDNRSAAEISCSAQAERLVLDRNRAQNVRLDTVGSGARTIMEETDTTAGWSRDAEYTERQRLTRECLRRVDEDAALRARAQGGGTQGRTQEGTQGGVTQPGSPSAPAAGPFR